MSDALTWQLIKNFNSFQVKRGNQRDNGAVTFSREAGNLTGLNSFKFSGLANSKTVDLSLKDKTVTLTTKKAGRKARKPSTATAAVPLKKGFRKVAKTIVNTVAANNYRADLKAAALARWTKLDRVAKIEKGVLKKAKSRRARNVRN